MNSFYLHDALGSVRGLTNTAGTVTDTYDYTAFGELYTSTDTTPNPYQFTGHYFDATTDLYQMRARYYDPGIGPFLSRDTSSPQPPKSV